MTVLTKDLATDARASAAGSAYRSLMVQVRDTPAGRVRLDSAVALADRLDAALIGVGAEGIDPLSYSQGAGVNGALIADLQATIAADLRRGETLFEAVAAPVQHEWLAFQAQPIAALAALSCRADLILAAGGQDERNSYRSCGAAELVIRSGRPVLVVSETGGRLHAKAVIVAWKDTREARRALADALPFLMDAEEVLVLGICDRGDAADTEAQTAEVVRGLEAHGVTARSAVRTGAGDSVAFELEMAAEGMGADLIVAGGYGRSRLGEWVFGGVTRDLLHAPRRFLLLSH